MEVSRLGVELELQLPATHLPVGLVFAEPQPERHISYFLINNFKFSYSASNFILELWVLQNEKFPFGLLFYFQNSIALNTQIYEYYALCQTLSKKTELSVLQRK